MRDGKSIELGTVTLARGIEAKIYAVRNAKVMLSFDLAEMYRVDTRVLVQAVKRNIDRFPSDFAFILSNQELENLKSQSVISSWGGSRRGMPFAFTEQGVAMLSSVLRSKTAVAVNVEVMRAFVRLRGLIDANRDLARRIDVLESKYDKQFKVVFDAMRELMAPPDPPRKRRIGFIQNE